MSYLDLSPSQCQRLQIDMAVDATGAMWASGILLPSRIRLGGDGRMQISLFPVYKIGIIYSYSQKMSTKSLTLNRINSYYFSYCPMVIGKAKRVSFRPQEFIVRDIWVLPLLAGLWP